MHACPLHASARCAHRQQSVGSEKKGVMHWGGSWGAVEGRARAWRLALRLVAAARDGPWPRPTWIAELQKSAAHVFCFSTATAISSSSLRWSAAVGEGQQRAGTPVVSTSGCRGSPPGFF